MSTAQDAKVTYRRTKTGQWVVYGPYSSLYAGKTVVVAKRDGSTKTETIVSTGKPFSAPEGTMVYGYTAASTAKAGTRPAGRAARSGRRSCVTGGNCSSFGTGRSCGGHDCDGY